MSIAAEIEHENAAHARQVAIYRVMTPQQRLQPTLRMNRTMRALPRIGSSGDPRRQSKQNGLVAGSLRPAQVGRLLGIESRRTTHIPAVIV